jgi:hypothetical protein
VSIPAIAHSVLKYLESFGLACIAQTRDGRLIATRNPAGHDQAWWGLATDLGPVIKRASADSGDVAKAAAAHSMWRIIAERRLTSSG